MSKLREKWGAFILCAQLIANISVCANAEQPSRLTVDDANSRWRINATIDDSLMDAHLMSAQCTETIDIDAAAALLLSSDEKSRAKREKIDYSCYNRAGSYYEAIDIRVDGNDGIDAELFSYPGSFSYSRSFPVSYKRSDYEDGYGVISSDGIAANCSLSKDEAHKKAEALLNKLDIPFTYKISSVVAYSPTNETYLTVGFYEVYFQQVISGVPVAIYNCLPYRENPGTPTFYPEYSYGITVRVFDSGVYSIKCEWLETAEKTGSQAALLPLSQAVDIFSAYFVDHPSADISPKPMQIDSICLEYAVCGSADAYLLIPSWTFSGDRNQTMFYGLRISAVDGSTILFDGNKQ